VPGGSCLASLILPRSAPAAGQWQWNGTSLLLLKYPCPNWSWTVLKDGKYKRSLTDGPSQTDWLGLFFFPPKTFPNFIHFSPNEIVKPKLGGPSWHNACSPSTPFLTLQLPGDLSGVTYCVRWHQQGSSSEAGPVCKPWSLLNLQLPGCDRHEAGVAAASSVAQFESEDKNTDAFPHCLLAVQRWLGFLCCLCTAFLFSLAVLVTQHKYQPALCKYSTC